MANKTSPHILSTSTNLLGFCLFIIISIHLSNESAKSFIDEFASVIAVLLVFSSLFSFVSIRTENVARERRLENIADVFFAIALIGVLAIIVLIFVQFWGK